MKTALLLAGMIILAGSSWLVMFLFRPFLDYPASAELNCLRPEAGRFEPLGKPAVVYGLGLSYAGHIAESPGLYEPGIPPPVFRKRDHTVNRSETIPYPTRDDLIEAAGNVDPENAAALKETGGEIPPLLDYEVEIGLAVIEPISADALEEDTFAPPVGFFVANDITARMLIAMAPSNATLVNHLAEGKGLRGFLPVGEKVWIPDRFEPDAWACVELVTEVNGEVRQNASSRDIILGPREILRTVARRFGLPGFQPGDWVITGTPPGVALQTPGWIQRGMLLLNPPAEAKMEAMGDAATEGGFLQPGDEVVVRAGFLGEKKSRVLAPVKPQKASPPDAR